MTEKYNSDGTISLDGSGVKILRLLEPQGEPDVIECDGVRYMPQRTCHVEYPDDARMCSICAYHIGLHDLFCRHCGAKVVE